MNEKTFGKHILNRLKAAGFDTMRIETASTISGCPDVWTQGAHDDFWIELKSMPTASVHSKTITVPWRPGQQGWAARYRINHSRVVNDVISIKCSWTFVGVKDGFIAIRMLKAFENNLVPLDDEDVFICNDNTSIKELLSKNTYKIIEDAV